MRHLLIFVLLLLIAAKVAAFVCLGPAAIESDARGYWDLSSLVLQGDVLMLEEPIAFRTPVYPWFLSLLRFAPSPLLAIAIAQSAMYLASVWFAAVLAARISCYSSAKVFTLLAMLPAVSAITYVGTTLTETLFVFLLMLNLLTVIDYTKHRSKTRAIIAGLVFGLTLLTRPIVLLLWIPHLLLVINFHFRRKYRHGNHVPVRLLKHFGNAILAGIVVLVMVAPWVGRNYHLFGKPFLTEFLGRNIWIVTFQDGSGAGLSLSDAETSSDTDELKKRLSDVSPDGDWQETQWRMTWTVSNALVKSGLNDAEADQLMKSVAWDAMKSDAPTVRYKSTRRIFNFWRCPATNLPKPAPGFNGFKDYPPTWSIDHPTAKRFTQITMDWRASQSVICNTVLAFIVAASCVFLIWYWPTRPFGIWIAMVLVYFCVVTGLVEIPDYRYRLVVEPIAGLTIGCVLSIGWARMRGAEPELELEIDL